MCPADRPPQQHLRFSVQCSGKDGGTGIQGCGKNPLLTRKGYSSRPLKKAGPSLACQAVLEQAGGLKNVSLGMEEGNIHRNIGEEPLCIMGGKNRENRDTQNDRKGAWEREGVGNDHFVSEMGEINVQKETEKMASAVLHWALWLVVSFSKIGKQWTRSLTSSSSVLPTFLSMYQAPKYSVF